MYLFLFLFWVIVNGKITLEILLFGLGLTVLFACLLKLLFDYSPKRELRFYRKLPLFIVYVFVLIIEIIKANVIVAGFVLFKKRRIDPVVVTFESGLKTAMGRFILANSITLTPGTITVRQSGDSFTVHCLHRSLLDVSENGVFMKWIRRLEA